VLRKADIMWELGELRECISYLENLAKNLPSITLKTIQLEQSYEREYGLPYGHPSIEKIEAFINWMKNNGAVFDKIRMKYYAPDYRGVHTTKQLEPSEVFLKVPKSLIITAQKGKETYLGTKMLKAKLRFHWEYLVYITVFILTQLHDFKSFWKPYMSVYPRDVCHFPIFYTNEEKSLLKGSPILQHIEEEIKEMTEEYEAIVSAVPEFREFSLEEYMKNKTLVISRVFCVKMNGVVERVIVPLADMCNHNNEQISEINCNDKEFMVTANKPIKAKDPICIYYGQKPNYRFLFYYGFLIEGNKHNCIYINLSFNKDDPNVRHKEVLIGSNLAIKTFKVYETHNDKLFCYLRFIEYKGKLGIFGRYLTPEVPNVLICKFLKRKLKCPILSLENERCVLKKVKVIATEYLSKYPDSYNLDIELLQHNNLSFNTRNCIILRSDEKLILRNLILLADIALHIIEMKTIKEVEEYLNQQKDVPYREYFEKSLVPFMNKCFNKTK